MLICFSVFVSMTLIETGNQQSTEKFSWADLRCYRFGMISLPRADILRCLHGQRTPFDIMLQQVLAKTDFHDLIVPIYGVLGHRLVLSKAVKCVD